MSKSFVVLTGGGENGKHQKKGKQIIHFKSKEVPPRDRRKTVRGVVRRSKSPDGKTRCPDGKKLEGSYLREHEVAIGKKQKKDRMWILGGGN